jgi:F-type H+-transporting ATPase subunit b
VSGACRPWRFLAPARLVPLVLLVAATPAWAAEKGGETFLGLPVVVWKTANMLLFFGLLLYLLGRPLASFFAARRGDIAQRLAEAEAQKEEAARLRAEMEARVSRLSADIAALEERLRAEGEREREALERQGDAEARRLLEQMEREAARRADEARARLAGEAAAVAAELSLELLKREMTPEDRARIFTETLERLRSRSLGGVS